MKDYYILPWSDNNYHWIKKKATIRLYFSFFIFFLPLHIFNIIFHRVALRWHRVGWHWWHWPITMSQCLCFSLFHKHCDIVIYQCHQCHSTLCHPNAIRLHHTHINNPDFFFNIKNIIFIFFSSRINSSCFI